MYIDKNRLRRALAAVAITTSAGLALAAAGAVNAEMNATPEPGSIHVAAGAQAGAPPGQRPDRVAAPASHVVVAGDSYWAIAEAVLGDDATPAEVLAKTEELIDLNSARLGADDPAMIHPGDVVYLEKTASTPEAVVREDARVLVAAAREMESRPAAERVVREDARVLVAAAREMESRPAAERVVREDARVLVAAAAERLG